MEIMFLTICIGEGREKRERRFFILPFSFFCSVVTPYALSDIFVALIPNFRFIHRQLFFDAFFSLILSDLNFFLHFTYYVWIRYLTTISFEPTCLFLQTFVFEALVLYDNL